MSIYDYDIEPKDEPAVIYCDDCHGEIYSNNYVFTYEEEHLCHNCFLKKILKPEIYNDISYYVDEDNTKSIADALFVDVNLAERIAS